MISKKQGKDRENKKDQAVFVRNRLILIDFTLARVGQCFKLLKKLLPVLGGDRLEYIVLQVDGEGLSFLEVAFTLGEYADTFGTAVVGIGAAAELPGLFHTADKRGDRVGIAGHLLGEVFLVQAGVARFVQPAEDGELRGGEPEVEDAASECLVQSVPASAQKRWQLTRVRRQVGGGFRRVFCVNCGRHRLT